MSWNFHFEHVKRTFWFPNVFILNELPQMHILLISKTVFQVFLNVSLRDFFFNSFFVHCKTYFMQFFFNWLLASGTSSLWILEILIIDNLLFGEMMLGASDNVRKNQRCTNNWNTNKYSNELHTAVSAAFSVPSSVQSKK